MTKGLQMKGAFWLTLALFKPCVNLCFRKIALPPFQINLEKILTNKTRWMFNLMESARIPFYSASLI